MRPRYAFLDVYRGIIVLLMIEGHVVRELLTPMLQATRPFQIHEVLHGITGPGFLFGAGITFGISAQRRWAEFLAWTPVLARRIRKITMLILVGYVLHLPFFSLQKTLTETTPAGWTLFFSFDVLQCIGFSLLIVQVLMLIIRKERWFAFSILCMMAGVLISTPILWNRAESFQAPALLSMALHGATGSVYPLFPFSAFLFAGAFASYEFIKSSKAGMEVLFVKRLAITGVLLNLAGAAFEVLPVRLFREIDFWHTSPNFMLMKLGGLFLLMSGSWFLENRIRSFPRWIIVIGIESFLVYVLHLLVLYGSVVNANVHLSALWKNGLDWAASFGIAGLLTVLLYGFARVWNVLRTNHPIVLRTIVWWTVTVFGYEFLTRPY